MRILLFALLVAAAAPLAVHAQSVEAAYYGLAIGEFDYEEGDGAGGEFLSDTVSSYRLMVGYRFMEHLAVEGGYGETGTIRDTGELPLFGGGTVPLEFNSDFKILTIRLLGVLPFDSGLSLLGGISYADMKQDVTFSIGGGPQQSIDIDGNEPAYYLGVQYDWDRFAIRAAYEKYDFDGDVDASETSVVFFYKL